MGLSVSDELIALVRDIPVSEVIGRYLPLTRRGTQTLCVCPFHDDHNPSLNINDNKQMWYCFVDQLGGDGIKFVMLYKNKTFVEALQEIAQQFGIDFDQYTSQKNQSPKLKLAYKLLSNTQALYAKFAERDPQKSFAQFKEKRGLSDTTGRTYGLGLAPGNNALVSYLHSVDQKNKNDHLQKLAFELGLIRPSQRGPGYYDTFRDRLMFPISDGFGQVIGFTSRALDDQKQKPKYLNSPESFLFNKRDLLYGLHLAKPRIRSQEAVIVVEGNMDQIALHQAGLENSVARTGLGLGESSLRRILDLKPRSVFLCLDNDQGGQKAMKRIFRQFLDHKVIPRFVDLSPYKDPDEFLQSEGVLAFQKILDEAPSVMDVELQAIIPQKIPELTEQKINYLHKAFELLGPLGTELSALERIPAFAKRLGLTSSSQDLLDQYRQALASSPRPAPIPKNVPEGAPVPIVPKGPTETIELQFTLSGTEKKLLTWVIHHPQVLSHKEFTQMLEFVTHNEVKTYICNLQELYQEIDENEFNSIAQSLDQGDNYPVEILGHAQFCMQTAPPQNEWSEQQTQQFLKDFYLKLQEHTLRDQKNELIRLKTEAQTQEELLNILKELQILDQKLVSLRHPKRRHNVDLSKSTFNP